MADLQDLAPQLTPLLAELSRRAKIVARLRRYGRGENPPIPQAVSDAKMTRAYKALMGMSQAPWASLVVDSVQDRLEVGGIRSGDDAVDQAVWRRWQANAMDAESKLGHHSALRDGRAFATVWPGPDGEPEIVLDAADQMVVSYREGRHQPRHRVAALRRWIDQDGKQCVTLYRPDGLYKLREAKDGGSRHEVVKADGVSWEMREEPAAGGLPEEWPLRNEWGVVPVVEIATNRELQSGAFPFARGEVEHCLGLIDRIHLLTFLGLVVALWMGFPLRYALGARLLKDDDNKPMAPFESKPDSVVQFEDPNAKIGQLEAADRKNLSIFAELSQLAYITKTPAHYFPMDGGFANISADAIRALEGGLHAKVSGIHQPFLGEGWEEVMRLAGLMSPDEIVVPPTAAVWWLDHESRSMAERADAATKVSSLNLDPLFIAEKYLNFTQEEIRRLQATRAGSVLNRMMEELERSAASNGAVPALTGA